MSRDSILDIASQIQEIKAKINMSEFCKLHGITQTKASRFPSKKFIDDLVMFDYLNQFYEHN